MIKKLNLLILTFVIIFTNIQTTYAEYTQWGPADFLEVTFRKLELCHGSNALYWQLREDFTEMNKRVLTEEYCENPVVLFTGEEAINVAGVDAGMTAGTLGEVSSLPAGDTYTHVRITVSRKFTIRNKVDENGKGIATRNGESTNCNTKAITDRSFGADLARSPQNGGGEPGDLDWTEENFKYNTIPAIAEDPEGQVGTPEKMNVYYVKGHTEERGWPWQLSASCRDEQCDTWDLGRWWYCYTEADCGSGLNKGAVGMSIPRKEGSKYQYDIPIDDIILIFKLTEPYTVVEEISPELEIGFGTSKGVSANATYGGVAGMCAMRMGWLKLIVGMNDTVVESSGRTRGSFR